MALTKYNLEDKIESTVEVAKVAVESVKDFFKNFINPNMTLEDIADVASPRLDELIKKQEANGLAYSAGKFHVKYADEKHFQLEFEMYFKDKEDKWHKVANESELRELSLLEEGAAKTLEKLKVITFPIEPPENLPSRAKADSDKAQSAPSLAK